MQILKTTDFVGKYTISQNTYSELASYIPKYEKLYLIDLLGVSFYNAFITDLGANPLPTDPNYLVIFNPLALDILPADFSYYNYVNGCGNDFYQRKTIISNGIKEMLMGFIYFEYMRDLKVRSTATGFVINQSENSKNASFSESNIYTNYNDSIKSYKAIQYYIRKNIDLYPIYNGSNKEAICFAI